VHAVERLRSYDGTKKILSDGEGYEKPNDGAKCTIEYEERDASGAVTVASKTLDIVVGDEHVPDALEEAITMMKLNERASVKLADGAEYMVTLTAMERAKEQYSMNTAEKIEAAERYKSSGNDAYKSGKYERANKKYAKALKFVDHDTSFSDEEKQASKKLKLSLNLNSAAVSIKTKSWGDARRSSEKVLDIESSNEKALYRHAQATMELQEYDESRRSLKKILEQDESHAEALRLMARLKALEARQAKKDAKIFGGMFSKMELYDPSEVGKKSKDENDDEDDDDDDEDTLARVMAANEADTLEVPPMDAPPAPDANEPMTLTHA
jgi:tetratricopeptide (TPR) repeat protein